MKTLIPTDSLVPTSAQTGSENLLVMKRLHEMLNVKLKTRVYL